jgi:hypothetical protein
MLTAARRDIADVPDDLARRERAYNIWQALEIAQSDRRTEPFFRDFVDRVLMAR